MKEGKRKRVVEEGVSELNWKEDEGAGFAKKMKTSYGRLIS